MTTPDLPPVQPLGPVPGTGDRPGPNLDDPTGLLYDRSDIEETTTATAGDGWAINGRGITVPDLLCGHLPGECPNDDECAYWRGVALGEYAAPDGTFMTPVTPLPAFPLRELAEQHITAVEWDQRRQVAS